MIIFCFSNQNLGNWDDGELKKLLDEAFTYKRPKDREHKSETFRVSRRSSVFFIFAIFNYYFFFLCSTNQELLQHAELEDQARADCFINCVSLRGGANHRHHHRSNQRHHHSTTQRSGSLQDLVEAVHNELDSDYTIGGVGGGSSMQQRRHAAAHNSGRHQKKYSSSVSSRPKEGGSLPTNVNCNLYEETFLNELNKGHNVRNNNNNHNHHNHHRAAAAPSAPSSSSTSSAVAAGAAAAPVASSSTKHHQKVAAHDGTGNSGNFVWLGYEPQGNESGHQVSHTVIEIESDETRHLLAHDSLAQVKFLNI